MGEQAEIKEIDDLVFDWVLCLYWRVAVYRLDSVSTWMAGRSIRTGRTL